MSHAMAVFSDVDRRTRLFEWAGTRIDSIRDGVFLLTFDSCFSLARVQHGDSQLFESSSHGDWHHHGLDPDDNCVASRIHLILRSDCVHRLAHLARIADGVRSIDGSYRKAE